MSHSERLHQQFEAASQRRIQLLANARLVNEGIYTDMSASSQQSTFQPEQAEILRFPSSVDAAPATYTDAPTEAPTEVISLAELEMITSPATDADARSTDVDAARAYLAQISSEAA